jgi:hypothetical protein
MRAETPLMRAETPHSKRNSKHDSKGERKDDFHTHDFSDSDLELPVSHDFGNTAVCARGDPDAEPPETDDEGENMSPFELLKYYWNRKAEKMTKVTMSPIDELIASPAIANNLFSRLEEHGGDVEVLFLAIDRIEEAEFWYGKTLGVTTFLKDTMFPKFLNREWGDFKTEKPRRY